MAVRKGRLFLFILLLLVVGLIVVGQLARRIPAKTVLKLELSGPVAEEDWPNFQARFWEGEVTVFRHLLQAIDRAKTDDRIAGISLEVHDVGMGLGKIQELRAKLQDFVASGKFCTAYLQYGDNRSYYLASACPEVYLTPTSDIFMTALMGHTTFLRGTLDKLHIYPDFYHIAEYKTATNIFTEKKFTPPHKEMVTSLLTGWQDQMIEDIAHSRKLQPEQVKQLVAGGPYLGKGAVEAKLVDKLLYYDQYRNLLKQKAGSGDLNTISVKSYLDRSSGPSGPTVAIVYATGDIVPGDSGYEPSLGRLMGADTVAAALRAARENDSVKAIVLRVDSPGGVTFASEVIRREVMLAKQKKPVVASMSDVAASGGYWISMSASKIVADPATITGSIGILAGKMNLQGFYNLLGMTKDYVALAPNATFFYPFENFTPEQRDTLMRFLRDGYDDFLKGVSEGRGLKVEEVDRIGRGRVWLGSQAKDLHLVDETGGLEQAVALAKQLAKIPAGQSVQYAIYPREKTLWEQFQDWLQVRSGGVQLRSWLDPTESRLWSQPTLVLMPFQVEAR